ncbi:MAG: glycosyltransferase family 4 protein [Fimbriimonadaceae bacterium]|nr:glycosyltransferase family 4 protein [Fimbriimonadaceae bacterium]
MPDPVVALDARLVGRQSTGDSTYWLGLLHGLARIESEFRFLLYSNAAAPPGIPVSPRFEWVRLPALHERWWSLAAFPLAARRRGARVLHTQYNLSPLVRRGGVDTIHDVSFFVGPDWFRPKDRALLRRFVPASARRAAKVITVSETSKRDVAHHLRLDPTKIAVTYLAPNPGLVPLPLAEARRIVQNELAIQDPYVLSVSTRWPRKNMGLAVAACEALDPSLPHRLVLTGKAGWGEEAPGRRVLRPGYVDDRTLAALYGAADLYVCPSRYEGFGLPVVEAFACGCPVAVSTGGSLPEIAGDAGLVVPGWDPKDWTSAIENLLRDGASRETMRAAGYDRRKRFDWDQTARETLAVYREAMADSGPDR